MQENPTVNGGRLYVGTSGWSYPHWAKGRFYPKGLKQGDWLAFLARHFPTVEVNSTFYRLPAEAVVQRWRGAVGSDFRFAVKLWRMITHRKRLLDCRRHLEDFFRVAAGFQRKRGPLLIQLPPSTHKDLSLLDDFLHEVRTVIGRKKWRLTVEFRHASWRCDEVTALLDRHHAALCLADMPRCPFTEPGQAVFLYVRRHGPGGRYRGRYSTRHITADAERIDAWLGQGKDVYVYYNNDLEGHAVDNAKQLLEAVAPSPRR